jgi:hypothetical protein
MAITNKEGKTGAGMSGDGTAMFGLHVVALIDFLGQSRELAKWDSVPQGFPPPDWWLEAVQNTVGRVLMWREEFKKRFTQFLKLLDLHAQVLSTGTPPEKLRRFNDLRETTLEYAHFSDTLIFYSPLQNQHGYWQVSNIAGFLIVCGALLIGALASKTVFRGAIEVGVLTRFPSDSTGRPGDPYGPALAKAHYLESKVAQYPRIVVGPSLLSYLDAVEKDPDQDAPARANRTIAADCRKYMVRDADDCWIADYLSDAFASTGAGPRRWGEVRTQAFAFVQSEVARFRKDGSDKLVERYEALEAYFRSHGSLR